ncbi:hypothetical protein E2C01_101559 [Portunus trituberculatus]|uniref:Uncharacterized protein n=1 Tax=Portunus trituberculatus TaxID=210409 RepID=A0A5B7KB21_PORTR|nr:hypothetical protein [Portunus trituberculatus]
MFASSSTQPVINKTRRDSTRHDHCGTAQCVSWAGVTLKLSFFVRF